MSGNTIIEKIEKLSHSPLAKGFGVTLVGSGVSKALLMLSTFIFTHLLSKDDFGSFSFIRNTLNVILCICALNYVGLVTKYTAELEFKAESKVRITLVFLFSLVVCAVIGTILVFLPDETMRNMVGEPSLMVYFRVVGLLLPLFMLQPLVEGALIGLKQFKLIGILQIVTACLFIAFVVIGILIAGVGGAIIGLLLYYLIYGVISIYIIAKKTELFALLQTTKWSAIKSEFVVLWTMILPVFILSFVEAPINWWSQVLMAKYDTIGSIGSMSAILQIRNLLMIIPSYFFSTFTTFQASLNAQGNQARYFSNLKKAFCVCLIIGILGSIILSLLGDYLLGLYGNAYRSEINAFYVAMSAFPMLITVSLMKSNMLIKEHQQFMLIMSVVASVFQLVTMYVLLPNGINPVSSYFWGQFVYCLTSFIMCIYCCLIDKREEKL